MHWKTQIYESARKISDEMKGEPLVSAVAYGGSVARGTVWKHSDLELCLLVDDYIPGLQYFGYKHGMGVEHIQILKQRVLDFLDEYERTGDATGLLKFPIQAYSCRIVADNGGVMARFKQVMDSHLFDPGLVALREREALERADANYGLYQGLLEDGRPNSALAALRLAVNELLLGAYWHYNILPRSQNRTLYLLRKNCRDKIGSMALYEAFRDIYGVGASVPKKREMLADAKPELFAIYAGAWGESAPEFLEKACDGKLEWGHADSIVYVHKYCVHVLLAKKMAEGFYDSAEFAEKGVAIRRFLGFDGLSRGALEAMAEKYLGVRSTLA